MSEQQENAGEMLQRLADDAQKWAKEFCAQYPSVPEDEAFGWFANAIENSFDVRFHRLVMDEPSWADFKEQVENRKTLYREILAYDQ